MTSEPSTPPAPEETGQTPGDYDWRVSPSPPPPKRGWVAKFTVGFVVLLVLLALGRHFFGDASNGSGAAPQGRNASLRAGAQPVGVATVVRRDIHVIVNALGTATPLATVTVVSNISGYLREVGFTEGQAVKKGDFLAQIDDRPYQALKSQYEGQLAHDQGLLDQARKDNIRYQDLLKKNSIASQTADDQQYIVKQYEGTVAADQAQIDAQTLNIAYCHIVSPVDGRVGLRLVDPGNYVAAGSSAGLVVVTEIKPMSVEYSVPEDVLSAVAPQLRAGKALSTRVYDRANVKKLAEGETKALDNQVDTTTGMVKLRAFFANDDEALFPNQFVNVRLLASTIPQTLAAPVGGIQHGAPGDYAWAVGADNKVSAKVVKLGQADGDWVQILDGLNEGDRIVVDGADRLRDGGDVRVVAGGATGAPGDATPPASSAPGAPAPSTAPSVAPEGAAAPASDPAREERRKKWRERQQNGGANPPAGGQ